MIGGSPVQPEYYPGAYPSQPVYQTYPQPLQPQRQPAQNGYARSTQPTAKQGQVRMQVADEAPARRILPPLEIPSPDRLGLGSRNRVVEVDWANVHRRLQALSVASFHLQKLSTGFRFTVVVTSPNGERSKLESESETDVDAIEQVLTRAERGQTR